MTLLYIDDDAEDIEFFCDAIKNIHPTYLCLVAQNAKDGLHILETLIPDVIFLDINMPVMNGEQFLQEYGANKTSGKAPVLIVSTDSTLTRVSRMLELGASGYVRKPFTPEMMREALDRVLSPEINGSAACEPV